MTPMRLLWRLLKGHDALTLRDHTARLDALERKTDELERRQEAQDAIRRITGETR